MRKGTSLLFLLFIGVCLVSQNEVSSQTIVLPPCQTPFVPDPFGLRCMCGSEFYHLGRSATGQPSCQNTADLSCQQAQFTLCPEKTYFRRDHQSLTSDCYFCKAENCKQCNSNPFVCDSCQFGFYFDSTSKTCQKCPYGAKYCYINPVNNVLTYEACFQVGQKPENRCFCSAGQVENPITKECVAPPTAGFVCPLGTALETFVYQAPLTGEAKRCQPCQPEMLSCSFNPNGILVANECRPGFFQKGDNCEKCSEYCKTCATTFDNCTSCTLSGPTPNTKCLCPSGQHENWDEKLCATLPSPIICPEGTLLDTVNQVSGSTGNTRCARPPKPIENCQMLYKNFNTNQIKCEICQEGFIRAELDTQCLDCAENCSNTAIASQCIAAGWQQYDTQAQLCRKVCFRCPPNAICGVGTSGRVEPTGCVDRFFFDPIKKTCNPCDPICSTCSGSATNCTACTALGTKIPTCQCLPTRHFDGKNCNERLPTATGNCPNTNTAFFIDQTKDISYCVPCQPNQATCRALDKVKTVALSCQAGFWLQVSSSTAGTTVPQGNCLPCDAKCSTCKDSATNCLTCANGKAAPQCSCLSTEFLTESGSCIADCQSPSFVQYLSGSTKLCFSCQTRTNCAECAVEPVPATLLDPQQNGGILTENPLNPNELLTIYCKSCGLAQFVGQNRLCQKCPLQCATCAADGCLSCAPNRTNPPQCFCQPGSHFDGQACVQRDPNLQANCPPVSGQDITGAPIIIVRSYFIDPVSQVSHCVRCKPSEQSCRAINLQQTVARSCKEGFFFSPFETTAGTNTAAAGTIPEGVCKMCDPKCKSCSDATTCLTCANGKLAPGCNCLSTEWVRFDGSCSVDCKLPNVEVTKVRNNVPVKYCFECHPFYNCRECQADPVDATLSDTEFSKLGGKVIFVANDPTNRFVVGCQSCNPGTFLDTLTTRVCLKCSPKCATCGATASECLTCSPNRDLALKCECASGFFENSAGICEQVASGGTGTVTCPVGTVLFTSTDGQVRRCLSCGWGVRDCQINPNVDPLDPKQIPVIGICPAGTYQLKVGIFGNFLKFEETPANSDGRVEDSQLDPTRTYIPYSYCSRCSPICETCRSAPDICQTCRAPRVLSKTTPPVCECGFLTHENFKTKACEPLIKDRVYFDREKYGRELCPIGTAFLFNDVTATSRCVLCPQCCSECSVDLSSTTTTATNTNIVAGSNLRFKCPAGATQPGTFFDVVNQSCPQCDFRCATCFEKPTNCRSCSSDLRDLTKSCACKTGTQEVSTTGECITSTTSNPPQNSCVQPSVYVPIDSTTGKCEKCVEGCGFCYLNLNLRIPMCEKCLEGYAPFKSPTFLGLTCVRCPDNCLGCDTDGQTSKCYNCKAGFFLRGGVCTPNCESRCATCEKYSEFCVTCAENRINPPVCGCPVDFVEDPITNKCVAVVQPPTDTTVTCAAGTFAAPDSTGKLTCQQCSVGCEDCFYNFNLKREECQRCTIVGYAYDPTTQSCNFHGFNVKHYMLCDKPGNFPILNPNTQEWECYPCPKFCSQCSVYGNLRCERCEEGLAFDSSLPVENPCRKCSSTCRTCSYDSVSKTEKCLSCYFGQVLDSTGTSCIHRLKAEPKCDAAGVFPAIDPNFQPICKKCEEQSKFVAQCTVEWTATGDLAFQIVQCVSGYIISNTSPARCVPKELKCPDGCLECKEQERTAITSTGSTGSLLTSNTAGTNSTSTTPSPNQIIQEIVCITCDLNKGFTSFNGYCRIQCQSNEFFNPKATATAGACQACPENCAVCNFNPASSGSTSSTTTTTPATGTTAATNTANSPLNIPLAFCLQAISSDFYIKEGRVFQYEQQCGTGEISDPNQGCRPCPNGCSTCSRSVTGQVVCDTCMTGFDKVDRFCSKKPAVCEPGFTNVFDAATQSWPCVKCSDQIQGCAHCLFNNNANEFQCFKCEQNFFRVPKKFDQVHCVDATQKCQAGLALRFSWDGRDIATAKVECQKCDANCLECVTNFSLDPSNTKSLPPRCTKCALNFVLNSAGTFCGGVTQCDEGFYLAKKDNFTFCAKCPDANAKSCNIVSTAVGTTTASLDQTQLVQSLTCQDATFVVINGVCSIKKEDVFCQRGLFKNADGKCVECRSQFENCLSCNPDKCFECPKGSILSKQGIACIQQTTQRIICGGNSKLNENGTICVCPTGFFYDTKLANCVQLKCADGSYMSKAGACEPCAQMTTGFCNVCDGPDRKNCQRCASGQRLNPNTFECESCGEVCEFCSEKGCLRCKPGYFFELDTESNLGRCVKNPSVGYVVLVDTLYKLNPEVFGKDSWLTTPQTTIDENDFAVAIGSKGIPIVDASLVPLEIEDGGNFVARVKGIDVRVQSVPCRWPCRSCPPTQIYFPEKRSCLANRLQCPYSTVVTTSGQLVCRQLENFSIRANIETLDPKGVQNADRDLVIVGKVNRIGNISYKLELIAAYKDDTLTVSNADLSETNLSSAANLENSSTDVSEQIPETHQQLDESNLEEIRATLLQNLKCNGNTCVVARKGLPAGVILKFTITASGPDGTVSDTFQVVILRYVKVNRPFNDLGIDPNTAITVTPQVAESLVTQVVVSYSYLQSQFITQDFTGIKQFRYTIEIFPTFIGPNDQKYNIFVPSDFPQNTFVHVFHQVTEVKWATVRFTIKHFNGDSFVYERKVMIKPTEVKTQNSPVFQTLKEQRTQNKPVDLTQLNTVSTSLVNQITLQTKKPTDSSSSTPQNSTTTTPASPTDTQITVDQDTDTKQLQNFKETRPLSACDPACPTDFCKVNEAKVGICVCPEGQYGDSCNLTKEDEQKFISLLEDVVSMLKDNKNSDADSVRQKTATIQSLSQIKEVQSPNILNTLSDLLDETSQQADDEDGLLEILFSISNLRETIAKDHLAPGVPQDPTKPPAGNTTNSTNKTTDAGNTKLRRNLQLTSTNNTNTTTNSTEKTNSTNSTNSTNGTAPATGTRKPILQNDETKKCQQKTDKAVQNVVLKLATKLDEFTPKQTIREGQLKIDITQVNKPQEGTSAQNAKIRLESDFASKKASSTTSKTADSTANNNTAQGTAASGTPSGTEQQRVNVEFDADVFSHFEGKALLQIVTKPKHFDSRATNYKQVSNEVLESIDFQFLEDKTTSSSTSTRRDLQTTTSTTTTGTSKMASVSKPKVKEGSAIKLQIPRKRDEKFSAVTEKPKPTGSSTSSLPTSTQSASIPFSGNTSVPITTSAPLGGIKAPEGNLVVKNPCGNRTQQAGIIAEASADMKKCLIRKCMTLNDLTGQYEQNCKILSALDGKFEIETTHFTEFVIGEQTIEAEQEAILEIKESKGFDFYQSKAFHLFLAIISIFGVAMIAGLVSDCMTTTSTNVYPLGVANTSEISDDQRCSAMLNLRNPIRLFTLTTPQFSRFFRILFYFCYVFFLYALAGHLSQHIALFLAVGVIGGFVGIVINVLKGFYVASFVGQIFSIFFMLCGFAISATMMRLAPGFTDEESNDIWMMNALLAIIFDLVITDTIRPFFTLLAFRLFQNSSFANYLFDNQSLVAFIEKNIVKPSSAPSYDNVKQNQSMSMSQSAYRNQQFELANPRSVY